VNNVLPGRQGLGNVGGSIISSSLIAPPFKDYLPKKNIQNLGSSLLKAS
jgi:hypothetical protein